MTKESCLLRLVVMRINSFMAVSRKSLSEQFLTSQRARYLSFYNFNDQQLNLLIDRLNYKLALSSVKLKLIKTNLKDTEVIAA